MYLKSGVSQRLVSEMSPASTLSSWWPAAVERSTPNKKPSSADAASSPPTNGMNCRNVVATSTASVHITVTPRNGYANALASSAGRGRAVRDTSLRVRSPHVGHARATPLPARIWRSSLSAK